MSATIHGTEQPRATLLAPAPLRCAELSRSRMTADERPIRLVPMHRPVFKSGDSVRHVFEVTDGLLIIWSMLADGRRQILQVAGPGDYFGFSADRVHRETAEAVVASRIRAIPLAKSLTSVEEQEWLLCQAICQMQALKAHTMMLGQMTAIERIAAFLLSLVPIDETGSNKTSDRLEIKLLLTRQEIGDYLGLKIETVSRNLGKLRRKGLIAFERPDRIRLLDYPALRRMAQQVGSMPDI